MKAGETSLQKLMNSALQFIVPIYQRTYSWTLKQCNQLWKDVISITSNKDGKVHFIGSVVYIDLGTPLGRPQQLLLIDGQQRITTFSLLLCALVRYMDNNKVVSNLVNINKIRNQFLINGDEISNDKYKLVLTEQDKDTYLRILDGTEGTLAEPSVRIMENFNYFVKIINESGESVDTIYEGINRLMLVAIALDKTHDNPQLIFESMNSTGKDLSQADLIRNYILMGLTQDEQNRLYSTYWRPMEQGFGQQGYADYFDWFMRDFLTSQNNSGHICKINEVYDTFKAYRKSGITNEQLLIDVFKYSKYYISMHLGKEKDDELKSLWEQLRTLDVSVSYPFLMRVYNDYKNQKISKQDFVIIIKATLSYVVRRVICEIPTNSLNKTFATFYSKIKQDNYVASILAEYVVKDSYRTFPADEEIKEKLLTKDIYHLRIKNYLLEMLENYNHKEIISITKNSLTVEHIMPQNLNLNKEWRDMLGQNWKEVQKEYLHTLGNLTLTGYNSEMSDKSFDEKQTMEGGFIDSHLKLNHDISTLSKWDEGEILSRANKLAEQVVSIWKYPTVSQSEIDEYVKANKTDKIYISIDHYQKMLPQIEAIYETLDRKILNLDSGIRKEYKKDYIAYKVETNFVDIEPYKGHLKMWLNMPFEDVDDPKGLCKDVTNIGHMGNGNAEIKITNNGDMDYIIQLAIQALNYQLGD